MADMNQWVNTQRRKALEELLADIGSIDARAFVGDKVLRDVVQLIDKHIEKYK